MQAANVGDSAAYFARVPVRRSCAPSILQLTGDHRYTNPEERERLAGALHAALIEPYCLPKCMSCMFSLSLPFNSHAAARGRQSCWLGVNSEFFSLTMYLDTDSPLGVQAWASAWGQSGQGCTG